MANVTLSAPIYRHKTIIISKSEYYISLSEYLEAEKSNVLLHSVNFSYPIEAIYGLVLK